MQTNRVYTRVPLPDCRLFGRSIAACSLPEEALCRNQEKCEAAESTAHHTKTHMMRCPAAAQYHVLIPMSHKVHYQSYLLHLSASTCIEVDPFYLHEAFLSTRLCATYDHVTKQQQQIQLPRQLRFMFSHQSAYTGHASVLHCGYDGNEHALVRSEACLTRSKRQSVISHVCVHAHAGQTISSRLFSVVRLIFIHSSSESILYM